MARSKSVEAHAAATVVVTDHDANTACASTLTDGGCESSLRQSKNKNMDSSFCGEKKKKKTVHASSSRNPWNKVTARAESSVDGDDDDDDDETSSVSTTSSTSTISSESSPPPVAPAQRATIASAEEPVGIPTVLHPIRFKRQHIHPQSPVLQTLSEHEDDENGWRIRARYLHCLGMDNALQLLHDHPKPHEEPKSSTTIEHGSVVSADDPSHSSSSGGNAVSNFPPAALMALRPSPSTTVLLKNDYGKKDRALYEAAKKALNTDTTSNDDNKDKELDVSISLSPVYPIKGVIRKKKQGKAKALPPTKNTTTSTRGESSGSMVADDAAAAAAAAAAGPIDEHTSQKTLSFYPCVQVREIPSHHQYSERIKQTIWMLPREYVECITRNAIEYMAEGYEPEGVLDETDFVERDGQWVHPVCELLDEPENLVLKGVYYGKKPTALKKEANSKTTIVRRKPRS